MSTIKVKIDESCEMACVELNGKCIMEGNYWDFHPYCQGIHEYGDFKSYTQLANNIKLKLGGNIVYDYTWKYKD